MQTFWSGVFVYILHSRVSSLKHRLVSSRHNIYVFCYLFISFHLSMRASAPLLFGKSSAIKFCFMPNIKVWTSSISPFLFSPTHCTIQSFYRCSMCDCWQKWSAIHIWSAWKMKRMVTGDPSKWSDLCFIRLEGVI